MNLFLISTIVFKINKVFHRSKNICQNAFACKKKYFRNVFEIWKYFKYSPCLHFTRDRAHFLTFYVHRIASSSIKANFISYAITNNYAAETHTNLLRDMRPPAAAPLMLQTTHHSPQNAGSQNDARRRTLV